eukprot:SAG22_NODE_1401_length_4497_cov_101.460891_4_plen_57_part_00
MGQLANQDPAKSEQVSLDLTPIFDFTLYECFSQLKRKNGQSPYILYGVYHEKLIYL